MPSIPAMHLPARIWNFPGAYVVWFMTGVASSAAIYTMYHYVKESPDVEWCAEMRHDELKTNPYTEERARAHTQNSFFRWVGNLRDRTVPGGPNVKDTRIWRI